MMTNRCSQYCVRFIATIELLERAMIEALYGQRYQALIAEHEV